MEPLTADVDYLAFYKEMELRISEALNIPTHIMGEYRNPFDFLSEFPKWFEFVKRKHADGEPTQGIAGDMLSGDSRQAGDYLETRYSSFNRREAT